MTDCRRDAAERTGIPAERWRLIGRTAEGFDHHLSLPDADYSGVMTMEQIGGERIVLQHGAARLAYHIVDGRQTRVLAETWSTGEFPRYAPACLDMAHRERRRGNLDGAERALQAAKGNSRWNEGLQADLELAEVRALRGDLTGAARIYSANLRSTSLEAFTIAAAGRQWLTELRRHPGRSIPPPSSWAELELHPWWRPVTGAPVSGIPTEFPAIGRVLANAQQLWQTRLSATRRDQGVA